MVAWRAGGVSLPHYSGAQYSSTTHIPMSAIQPGDLIFYESPSQHVALYIGGGQIIHAPHPGGVVEYASLYYENMIVTKEHSSEWSCDLVPVADRVVEAIIERLPMGVMQMVDRLYSQRLSLALEFSSALKKAYKQVRIWWLCG